MENHPSLASARLAPFMVVAALAAIAGALGAHRAFTWQCVHWIAKPSATALLLLLAATATPPVSPRYRRWIVAGLAASLLGDVLLMLPANLFVPGLVAFLLAHGCYLVALTADARLGVRPLGWLACLAFGVLNLWLLWPSLLAALRAPVIVYVLVLTTMGGQALGRARHHAIVGDALARPARRAAIGAACFMLSDTLLAWDRFHAPLPLAPLCILGTYYAAQGLLAGSVRRVANEGTA